MKTNSELRILAVAELEEELLLMRKQQLRQRMQRATGSLDKTHVIPLVRRYIARIKTIISEKETRHDNK